MGTFKTKLKKILPSIVTCIYGEWKYRDVIKKYREGQKNIKKRKNDHTLPKVAFIIQFPEVWNSIYTVYEAARKAGIPTLLLSVPKAEVNYSSTYTVSSDGRNEAYDFFCEKNIEAVNAYDCEHQSWYDLKEFEPDYVFYARPYNSQYPECYRSNVVCGYSNICYIPYAYSQTTDGLFSASFNYGFALSAYLSFVPSKIRLLECEKRFALQKMLNTNKYVFLGFPRFDLLTAYSGKEAVGEVKTFAWLPRWTVDKTENQKSSSFFKYIDKFLEYMKEHQEAELIIRPHPLMFKVVVETGMMQKQEVEDLKARINSASNVYLDETKSYIETLIKADALISDFSSLLMEYFVTGKPIIYCDSAEGFNSDALLMDKTLYHAYEWNEIVMHMESLYSGQDAEFSNRQNVVAQLMPKNAGHIGEEILNYILCDFRDLKGKIER